MDLQPFVVGIVENAEQSVYVPSCLFAMRRAGPVHSIYGFTPVFLQCFFYERFHREGGEHLTGGGQIPPVVEIHCEGGWESLPSPPGSRPDGLGGSVACGVLQQG